MRESKARNGKEAFDEMFQITAENKIKESGYDYLNGYYYFLLTDMAYTSAWNYVYKVVKFLNEEEINDPSKINLGSYVKHLASLKGTSSSNQITSYAALKRFSKYIYASKMCSDDYMQYVSRPKAIETPEQIEKREKGIITKEEYEKALERAYDDNIPDWEKMRNITILNVFVGTGIRRAALYKLDIDNLNLDSGIIIVSEKGDKYRKVYCPHRVVDCIEEWLEHRKYLVDNDEKALFISKFHKRLCDKQIAKIIKKYVGKSPHKLRATYMTELYDKTNDIYLVQQAVGHSSPSTTQLYIRGKKEESGKIASEIMEKMMS